MLNSKPTTPGVAGEAAADEAKVESVAAARRADRKVIVLNTMVQDVIVDYASSTEGCGNKIHSIKSMSPRTVWSTDGRLLAFCITPVMTRPELTIGERKVELGKAHLGQGQTHQGVGAWSVSEPSQAVHVWGAALTLSVSHPHSLP